MGYEVSRDERYVLEEMKVKEGYESSSLLSHSKKPCNTEESYSNSRQPSQDSNKEKRFKKERCSCQSNENANRQTDKPSTSHETMIDRGNPRCGLNVSNMMSASLPNLYSAFPSDETRITSDAKIRTWLHQSVEKRALGSRETNNVQETLGEAVFHQLQSTSKQNRLSLKRRKIDFSDCPLSSRLSIDRDCISDRKNISSSVLESDELFDRLKVVRRDLNFKIRETDQNAIHKISHMHPGTSKSIELLSPESEMNSKMLENVRWKPDLRFVCSGLSAQEIITVQEFAAKHNASCVKQFDHDVTHVVVKTTGKQNTTQSTLKYIQGIAYRKWLVSYRWIEDCNMQQKLLDEVPYEATTQTRETITGPRNSRLRKKDLFVGFTFLCIEPYYFVHHRNISLYQCKDLLRVTGATVVDSFEALSKMGGMKGVVIQGNTQDDEIIKHQCRIVKAAPILVDWIVKCINHYKLFKLPCNLYFSSQDFSAIGYPQVFIQDEEYNDNI